MDRIEQIAREVIQDSTVPGFDAIVDTVMVDVERIIAAIERLGGRVLFPEDEANHDLTAKTVHPASDRTEARLIIAGAIAAAPRLTRDE